MIQDILKQSIQEVSHVSFSRSGGPGGQNVNKVNTKVYLTVALSCLKGISAAELSKIKQKLSNRIIDEDILYVTVEEERSQLRNREIALDKVFYLLANAAKQERKRIPTKPSKSSKLNRLNSKKLRSSIKGLRSKPIHD